VTGELILSIETATPICSVVLSDGITVTERRTDVRGAHAEQMPIFIKELLDEWGIGVADVDCVLLSAGPGSYTGLRIGASIVKGLLFGRAVPFFAINTLAGLAQGVTAGGSNAIHSVIDARRTHLYHQSFNVVDGDLVAAGAPAAKELADVNTLIQPGSVVVGTGWNRLDAAVLTSVLAVGLEAISAKNLDALYRQAIARGGSFDEGILRRAQIEIFEPDYRGNPYQ
jgi:tRNA threonylcarbamoyladenosine biosynthesis protein TsaB